MDFLLYILLRAGIGLLNLLPVEVRVRLLGHSIRLLSLFVPRFRKTSRKNLALAFPDKDDAWREEVLSKNYYSLARVIVDFARMGSLDRAWVNAHVDCDCLERLAELRRANGNKGLVIATGHLGSFELLAHCGAMYGHPMSFVVRLFKLRYINRWWTSIRERFGNRVISRDGAFREIVNDINAGRDVGILFDQNVKRNHAVFVDWFGRLAATTKAVALAALRTEVPVIVASISYSGSDRYKINVEECDFAALYADTARSAEEKVRIITQEVSRRYEGMIRQSPTEWFWMHRRWKTAPLGQPEDFYS